MHQRRYELTDFEWSIIQPLLPNKPRGVPRANDRRVLNGIYWRLRTGSPLGRYSRALRAGDDLLQSLHPVAEDRRVGPGFRSCFEGLRRRSANDRPSSIRVHQHAANVKKGGRKPPLGTSLEPDAWGARGAG